MSYAIVQTTLEKPSVDALRDAFRRVSWLTDIDASIMARDAYGIIVENQSYAQAEALSHALASQGIVHRMIDQVQMPELGIRHQLRRMDCMAEGPVIYDPLGRPIPGRWSDVRLVAAGLVGVREIQRSVKERTTYRGTGWQGGVVPVTVREISEKQVALDKLIMELYLGDGPTRFRVVADKFHYNYLENRVCMSHADNFALLVRDIARYAPHALFSQGVESLVDDEITTFSYPTEHAFMEEIRWLRWMETQRERG